MRSFTLLLVLFVLSVCGYAQPVVSSFSPLTAERGTMVIIEGTGFTSVTAVTFNGTPAASFTVISPTQINAVATNGSSGTGAVAVTAGGQTVSLGGFTYIVSSRIVTNFNGYWSTQTTANNGTPPNNSHDLLAFSFAGTLYSTGVNNTLLDGQGVTYAAGNFRALPVAGISGNTVSGGSTYLALAKRVDGDVNNPVVPAVSAFTVKTALTDGVRGLNLGTGVTNLPSTAVMTFPISFIDDTKIDDNEPDLVLTQIADPSPGATTTDIFSFIDASGNVVGNSIRRDMNDLASYGKYALDLFTFTPNTPYNTATPNGSTSSGTGTRDIRLIGVRLADFGITPGNINQVAALKVAPSGNSDYAFIAYNATAISLAPNVSPNSGNITTDVCVGGAAILSVVATPAVDGALSYTWEESINGGSTWATVSNGGSYSGATSSQLTVTNPTGGHQYRAIVEEAGNTDPGTSAVFVIAVSPATAGGAVSGGTAVVTGTNSTNLTLSAHTGSVTGWQSSTDNFNAVINNIAHTSTSFTATNLTQTTQYRAIVQSGPCAPAFSAIATIVVTGTVPIRMGSVVALKEKNGILVRWTAYDQWQTQQFEVEKSIDGIHFTTVHTIPSTGDLQGNVTYSWLDTDPVNGPNYYRVKEVYTSGEVDRSAIATVKYTSAKAAIEIYSNPVVGHRLTLKLNDMRAGVYQVRIINNLGQLVTARSFTHTGSSRTETLSLPSKIKEGLYRVEILCPDAVKRTYSIVVMP